MIPLPPRLTDSELVCVDDESLVCTYDDRNVSRPRLKARGGEVNDLCMDAVPSGSYLAIAHPTKEVHGEVMEEAVRRWNEDGSFQLTLRNRHEPAEFFDRLELLEPGMVFVFAVATRPR